MGFGAASFVDEEDIQITSQTYLQHDVILVPFSEVSFVYDHGNN